MALIRGVDPRFATLQPPDPNVIGACCSISAVEAGDGWTVTVEIGWGDCPAGCISRHHWIYSVTPAGAATLESEDGPPVPADVPGGGGATVPIGIVGSATAGPVCPVVRPNDPACADRPVLGAVIHVIDDHGTEVATLETDQAGRFAIALPPGSYRVQPDPVEGLMGTPAPVEVVVRDGPIAVTLTYDTGIR
jgi:hypothetical protein